MNHKSNANRRSRKRPPPKAQEGIGRRARWSPRFRDKIAIVVVTAILIPIVVFNLLSLYHADQPDQRSAAPGTVGSAAGPRAAIVDHLSLAQPNPAFVETATELLEHAGYAVDYYPAEEVTVEFYRHLPTWGHELIILRVHSARLRDEQGALTDLVGLFTSEPYSQARYVEEQKADRVRPSRIGYVSQGLSIYFGITPRFIESSMKGEFDDTTVILMGCDGLRSDETAKAFLERGARTFVSWSGPVSAGHTDAATEHLLQHLLVDGLTIQQAVVQTMADVGSDPSYGSVLRLYP